MYLTICQACWDGDHETCEGGQCECPADVDAHGAWQPYEED